MKWNTNITKCSGSERYRVAL